MNTVIPLVLLAVAAAWIAQTSLTLAFVPLIGLFAFLFWRVRAVSRLNNLGAARAAEGRIAEARELFRRAERTMSRPIFRFNLGLTEMWLWRLDEAERLIDGMSRSLGGRTLRVMAVPYLMLIASYKNDAATAARLYAEAERLDVKTSPAVQLARAVSAARQNQWADVLSILTLSAIRPLGGLARATADALRGWAIESTGGNCPPVDVIGIFGETGPEAMRRYWPEFAAFLESH